MQSTCYQRFIAMNEREIFIGALQHEDPAGQRAYLDQACADDPGLRQRVDALLRVAEKAGSFLASAAPELAGTLGEQAASERAGTDLEHIGAGANLAHGDRHVELLVGRQRAAKIEAERAGRRAETVLVLEALWYAIEEHAIEELSRGMTYSPKVTV